MQIPISGQSLTQKLLGLLRRQEGKRRENRSAYYGYKLHLLACATWELPLAAIFTTAKRADNYEAIPLLQQAQQTFEWFAPKVVLADKGYDSTSVHAQLKYEVGALPVIDVRVESQRAANNPLWSERGVPYCIGGQLMAYVRPTNGGNHLYRCPVGGCRLKSKRNTLRGGTVHCRDSAWLQAEEDLRRIGYIARASGQWKRLYAMRSSVERLHSGLKETRRLERHCFRGLAKVRTSRPALRPRPSNYGAHTDPRWSAGPGPSLPTEGRLGGFPSMIIIIIRLTMNMTEPMTATPMPAARTADICCLTWAYSERTNGSSNRPMNGISPTEATPCSISRS